MTTSHLREVSADGVIMTGDVAAELYATRLQRGIELREVAAELRIQYDHLLAIEEGRFSDLPGPAYVFGFLRSYAVYLDLDADDLVRRFKAETSEIIAPQELNILEPYDEGGVPTGALVILALVLVVGAYGSWYYLTNFDDVASERVSEVPERMVAALAPEPLEEPAAVESAAPEPVAAEPEPVEPEPVAAEPEPVEPEPVVAEPEPVEPEAVEPEPLEAAVEEPAEQASPPKPAVVLSQEPFEEILAAAIDQSTEDEAAPEAAPEPAVEPIETEPLETASLQPMVPAPVAESSDYQPREFGQANAGSTITLRAVEEIWVQVTGENNELLLTRILGPGDVYHVPDRPGLVLMTSNAGGIEILVGDKMAPPLGETGKVRREVALDPERLLAGTAINP